MTTKRRKWPFVILGVLVMLLLAGVAYFSDYYRADDVALAALESDADVTVEETEYGWRFDGPSTTAALVFYPGAKVEASAYAPLLHLLAHEGVDACLVRMPLNFALFDGDAAARVIEAHDYDIWYVGGHSLGGVAASGFAADHSGKVRGVVLCASYPNEKLGDDSVEIQVLGAQDGVIDREKVESARAYAPESFVERVIEGANHAQFGSYGKQDGDGEATITPEEQWRATVGAITAAIAEDVADVSGGADVNVVSDAD